MKLNKIHTFPNGSQLTCNVRSLCLKSDKTAQIWNCLKLLLSHET